MLRTLTVLVIALVGPPLFAVLPGNPYVLQLLYCGFGAFFLWFIVAIERRSLDSIHLRLPTWSTFVTAAVALGFVLYGLPMLTSLILGSTNPPGIQAGVTRLAAFPAWFRILIAVTGGFIEELLYRGFAIERLTTLTGRRWLAATISIVAFTFAHVPWWGVSYALAADLPFAVFMTLLYLWKRDLAANILTHSGALVVQLLLLP